MSLKERTAVKSIPSLVRASGRRTASIEGQAIRVCIAVGLPSASSPAFIRTMLAGR